MGNPAAPYAFRVLIVLLCLVSVASAVSSGDAEEDRSLTQRLTATVGSILGEAKEGTTAAKVALTADAGDIAVQTGPGFYGGFVSGIGMIIATEIGDKTFFIAAIMAMQYSRTVVFGGAISALAVMTVLSAALGFALPNVLPRQYTHYLGALLFLYFGYKMIKEGLEKTDAGPSDELAEVEQELLQRRVSTEEMTESGVNGLASQARGINLEKNLMKVFTQSFTLTFLAEWGDRSQIATIALAAAMNVVGVTLGGILGHSLCTGLAVLGGRLLAARISERTVHLFGGALFLVFGLHSLIFGL